MARHTPKSSGHKGIGTARSAAVKRSGPAVSAAAKTGARLAKRAVPGPAKPVRGR